MADTLHGLAKAANTLEHPDTASLQQHKARRVWSLDLRKARHQTSTIDEQTGSTPSRKQQTSCAAAKRHHGLQAHTDRKQPTTAQTMVAMEESVMDSFESHEAPYMMPPPPLQLVPEVRRMLGRPAPLVFL